MHRSPALMRTTARRVSLVLLALLAGLVGAGANAASAAPTSAAYRFWGYFQLRDGSWAASTKGADAVVPAEGTVEGWRWAVSGQSPRPPRGSVTFAQVCGSTPVSAGTKRVAVVVDPGRAADAASGTPAKPWAACAKVPTAATGAAVLAAVAPVRLDKGMVCGIDGWPATGCSDQVARVSAAQAAADDRVQPEIRRADEGDTGSGTSPATWAAVVGGLALLGLLAWLLTRRRRRVEQA